MERYRLPIYAGQIRWPIALLRIPIVHIERQAACLSERISAFIMEASAAVHVDFSVVLQRAAGLNGDTAVIIGLDIAVIYDLTAGLDYDVRKRIERSFYRERNAVGNDERSRIHTESMIRRNDKIFGERHITLDLERAIAVGNGGAELLLNGESRSFDGHGLFGVNEGAVDRVGADGDRAGSVTGRKNAV